MGFPGRERKSRRNLGIQELPGDTESKQEAQDGRAVTLHDRMVECRLIEMG